MKIRFLMLMALALTMSACQERGVSPNAPYTIEGEVTDVEDGAIIVLLENQGELYEVLSRDTLKNGKFSFEGQIREDNTYLNLSLHLGEYYSSIVPLHVKPGIHVKVKGQGHIAQLWEVDCPTPRQLLCNELNEYAREEIIAESNLSYELHQGGKEALHSWEDANKIGAAYQKEVGKKLERMKDLKVNEAWMEELLDLLKFNSRVETFPHKKLFKTLYKKLTEGQKQSLLGQEIYVILNPPQQAYVGELYPDADFYDLQGNLHHISEFKGKYILLDFWSRGCGPCLQAIPQMKEMYREMGDKLVMISISLDPEKHWRTASKQHEIIWNNWNEMKGRAGLYTNYRINAIPYYVLINPAGKIQEIIRGFNKNYLMEAINQES